MKTRIILCSLLAAATAGAAIKKAELPETSPKPAPLAPRPPAKTDPADPLADMLKKLRERGGQDGRQQEVPQAEFESMLRELLEAQGVPKEKLKDANFRDLLKLMQEQNPNGAPGFKFEGLDKLRELFGSMDPKIQKKLDDQFRGLLEGHRPGSLEAAKATFILRDGKKPAEQLSFGTAVNADGWLLTKASEVEGAGELQCEAKGAWVAAKVARTWKEHDLALVKVEAKDVPVAKWSDKPSPAIGSFITAASPDGKDPAAIGVVSVAERSQQEKGRGFLGVQLGADEKGLKIDLVVPGGAALKSGVQKDDRVLEVDGQKPESLFQFTKMISDRKAGEKVNLKLQRGEEVIEKQIALGDRANRPGGGGNQRSDKMNSMGSEISKRKGDFPNALQTDFPLNANECGGPVTDLDGNIIGLVIARSGRVETMILPSATIREVLGKVDFAKESAIPATPAKAEDGAK